MKLPFIEQQVGENLFIRTFKQETDSGDLFWGQDISMILAI